MAEADAVVGVLGASSFLGAYLTPALAAAGWRPLGIGRRQTPTEPMAHWVSLAPIWSLPECFPVLENSGVRRVVALSSASRFSKANSPDPAERALAAKIVEAEARCRCWARERGVALTLLQPTMIYDGWQDRNIAVMARLIRRFGCFPLLGEAAGLRQPVHAADVAQACCAALACELGGEATYALGGGETLSYRRMVERIFIAQGRRPWLPSLPAWLFRAAVMTLRPWPHCRGWSLGMAQRMAQDQVVDISDARRDLAFKPRPFVPPGAAAFSVLLP